MFDRGVDVVQPALQGEVTLGTTTAPEVHGEHDPTQLRCDALGQLGVRLAGLRALTAPRREPVAQHETRGVVGVDGRFGQMGAEREVAGVERVVHHRRRRRVAR